MKEGARYFGDLRVKKMVKPLVYWVEAPQPGDVNDEENPPASYWERMWNIWNDIRDHVLYALRKITGQEYTLKREWEIWIRSPEAKRLGIK